VASTVCASSIRVSYSRRCAKSAIGRPSSLGVNAEQLGHLMGEALDAQVGVENSVPKSVAAIRFCSRCGPRHRFQLQLEFAVDGLQLFVDRLQLSLLVSSLFRGGR